MAMLNSDEITRLSPAERLALISDLWDSISDAELAETPSQQHELKRRLTSFERDRDQAMSWEQLEPGLAARIV